MIVSALYLFISVSVNSVRIEDEIALDCLIKSIGGSFLDDFNENLEKTENLENAVKDSVDNKFSEFEDSQEDFSAVSYTHLTLPTIYSV